MRRRPAGRAEARRRRRRRLRGTLPPGEGRPRGRGRAPGWAGGRRENLWGGGRGPGAGRRRRRGRASRPARRGVPPPARRPPPRAPRLLCPRARGSQIGRETAEGLGPGAHLAGVRSGRRAAPGAPRAALCLRPAPGLAAVGLCAPAGPGAATPARRPRVCDCRFGAGGGRPAGRVASGRSRLLNFGGFPACGKLRRAVRVRGVRLPFRPQIRHEEKALAPRWGRPWDPGGGPQPGEGASRGKGVGE